MHVYVPVEPVYTYGQTQLFTKGVATYVAAEHKDIATVERVVSRRRGWVYVDFGQNRRGQTVVPPYVVRPRPKAPVSAPLDWDELDLDLRPTQFTLETMPVRLAKRDLFQGTLMSSAISSRADGPRGPPPRHPGLSAELPGVRIRLLSQSVED